MATAGVLVLASVGVLSSAAGGQGSDGTAVPALWAEVSLSAPGVVGDAFAVDVRIVARRVASGQVELALQQREPDGDWGGRLLPRQRFFPAETRVGRWLASTPLTVGGATIGAVGDQTQARIAARRVASGQVEFALQQRGGDGDWGGRLLPRQRFFSLGTRVGRWLVSTPLTLRAGTPPTTTDLPPSIDTTTTTPTTDLPPSIDTTTTTPTTTTTTPTTDLPPGIDTTTTPTTTTTTTTAPTKAAIVAAEAQMIELVNRLRRSLGLEPLAHQPDIAAMARRWSQTLQTEQDFYHNPNLVSQYPPGWERVGENIAAVGGYALADAVQVSFDRLVNSPGHYANMIHPDYTHLGVGIAVGGARSRYKFIVTQNFASYYDDTPR